MKLHKKILRSPKIRSLIAWLSTWLIRSFWYFNRWEYIDRDYMNHLGETKNPFLSAFWHSRILIMPFAGPQIPTPIFALISQHRDGQLIAAAVKKLKISTIFGSSRKRGAGAYMEIQNLLQNFCAIAITPDGPKGPAEKVKPGIIHLAQKTGVPIIPLSYATSRKLRLKSWDRFWVPLWFGRGAVVYGKPFCVPKDVDRLEVYTQYLEDELNRLTQTAEQRVLQSRHVLKKRRSSAEDS